MLKVIFFPVYLIGWGMVKLGRAMQRAGGPAPMEEYPQCINCKGRSFTFVTKPTFTVDRFSRQRIAAFVDCNTCGLRLRIMRGQGDKTWTFLLQG